MARNPSDNLKVVQSIAPTATGLTTTTNGAGVDCRGYQYALVVVNVGAVTGTSPTMDVKIQQSSDDGSSDAYGDVTSATFTQITASNDDTVYVGELKCEELERYLRPVATIGGTTPVFPTGVTFILSPEKYAPTTQSNDVAFHVPAITG